MRCSLDSHLRHGHDLPGTVLKMHRCCPFCILISNSFLLDLRLHWHVLCGQIVVRQVPVQLLAKHTSAFYASVLLIPSIAVVACWSFGGYGPFPGLDNCWINQGIDRFLYFHTFTILGVVISLTLGPTTGCYLWRAYRGVSDRADHARIFRVMLVRQILLACYGFLMSVAFLLGGVNTLYLKIDPDAHKTWYIKRTAYAYCMLGAVNFSTLGLFVSLIFFSSKSKGRELLRALRRFCCSACSGKTRAWNVRTNVSAREQADWQIFDDFICGFAQLANARSSCKQGRGEEETCQPSLLESSSKRELHVLVSQDSRPMTSPRSPGGRLLFPSAFDSGKRKTLRRTRSTSRFNTRRYRFFQLGRLLSLFLQIRERDGYSSKPRQ